MSAGWQDLLRRLRENDDLEFLKTSRNDDLEVCAAWLLRVRCSDAVVGVSVEVETSGRARMHPVPERARRPTRAPTGPARVACTCTQSIWASSTYGPMMDAPSALRGAGGCSSFSDRASALSAGDPSMLRTTVDAAAIARALRREPRAIFCHRLEIIA